MLLEMKLNEIWREGYKDGVMIRINGYKDAFKAYLENQEDTFPKSNKHWIIMEILRRGYIEFIKAEITISGKAKEHGVDEEELIEYFEENYESIWNEKELIIARYKEDNNKMKEFQKKTFIEDSSTTPKESNYANREHHPAQISDLYKEQLLKAVKGFRDATKHYLDNEEETCMQYRKEEAFQGCTDEEIISIIKEAYKNLLKICFRVNAEKTTWGLKEKDLIQLFVDEQGETLWQEEKDAFAELLGDKTIKEKHSQELIKIASGDLVKCSLPLWCVTSMWESVWERLWEQINKNNSHDRSE